MEAAFALLLPLVAGYLFVSSCRRLKYKHARDDGHRLYFRIAYYGLLLFVATAVLLALAYWLLMRWQWFVATQNWAVDVIKPILKDQNTASSQLGFLLICVGTVAAGRFAHHIDNRVFRVNADEALFEAAMSDDLELLLLEAAVQYKSISVTTSSGKVYVGLVLGTGEPKNSRRVIALLPLMSGYRTEIGKVIFTTFYDEAYAQRAQERDDDESNDFRLVLPVDKMVSISFFDLKVYKDFNVADRQVSATAPSGTG